MRFIYILGRFTKTIIPPVLVGYEMILAIYDLISNAWSWNNCLIDKEQRGQSDRSICNKTLVDLH